MPKVILSKFDLIVFSRGFNDSNFNTIINDIINTLKTLKFNV